MTRTARCTARRTAWLAAALYGAALLTGCGASKEAPPPSGPATNFALTDHNGHPFELSSLRGKTVMLFFGYSTCPDVCPTTLSKLVRVSRLLGADSARVTTLYVTVDPERDTPEVLKADLGLFRLDALGLTGSRAEVDKVVAQYGVKYEIVPTPQSAGKYTVSHSTTLYVLDANGALQRSFPYEATADEIVTGVKEVIAGGGPP
ncbi:MAG: SCO family protein [Gemmatimonadaceae bacterium]|nr:SCO family protein [Gemmatimonadaceae bacterium]